MSLLWGSAPARTALAAVVEISRERGAAAHYRPAQCGVVGSGDVGVQLGAWVVEAGNAAGNLSGLASELLGFDGDVAGDMDALAGCRVLHGDVGSPHGVNVADCRSVLRGYGAAGAPEKDRGERGKLGVVGAVVDVEHDLPWCRWLHAIEG